MLVWVSAKCFSAQNSTAAFKAVPNTAQINNFPFPAWVQASFCRTLIRSETLCKLCQFCHAQSTPDKEGRAPCFSKRSNKTSSVFIMTKLPLISQYTERSTLTEEEVHVFKSSSNSLPPPLGRYAHLSDKWKCSNHSSLPCDATQKNLTNTAPKLEDTLQVQNVQLSFNI